MSLVNPVCIPLGGWGWGGDAFGNLPSSENGGSEKQQLITPGRLKERKRERARVKRASKGIFVLQLCDRLS